MTPEIQKSFGETLPQSNYPAMIDKSTGMNIISPDGFFATENKNTFPQIDPQNITNGLNSRDQIRL